MTTADVLYPRPCYVGPGVLTVTLDEWYFALQHIIRMGEQKAHAWKGGDLSQIYNLDTAAWAFIKQFGE
jgi:hypothetical protein